MAEESKIIEDPQNFCNYSMMESSIMLDSQIAPSEHQDIQDHLETPMGNVSDEDDDENYLDKLKETL